AGAVSSDDAGGKYRRRRFGHARRGRERAARHLVGIRAGRACVARCNRGRCCSVAGGEARSAQLAAGPACPLDSKAGGMKELIRQLCPPLLWSGLQQLRGRVRSRAQGGGPGAQDLEVYWDPRMAEILEQWGEGNAWSEIQLLLTDRRGTVLD